MIYNTAILVIMKAVSVHSSNHIYNNIITYKTTQATDIAEITKCEQLNMIGKYVWTAIDHH